MIKSDARQDVPVDRNALGGATMGEKEIQVPEGNIVGADVVDERKLAGVRTVCMESVFRVLI